MSRIQLDPEAQVIAGNPWYTSDQKADQLGDCGTAWVVDKRREVFEKMIRSWVLGSQDIPTTLSVLDAGSGDGINIEFLESILKSLRLQPSIIATDYNLLRLHRINRKDTVSRIQADLSCMPFRDRQFDLILCSHVLEHIPGARTAMNELSRLVKATGVVIVAVPNEGCAAAWLRNHVFQRSILSSTDHVHFLTERSLKRLGDEGGLRPIGPVEREGFFFPHLGVANILRRYPSGRRLSSLLSRIFPSQAAGLIAVFQPGLSKGQSGDIGG
jgi:SAM-dependent methyltransferase